MYIHGVLVYFAREKYSACFQKSTIRPMFQTALKMCIIAPEPLLLDFMWLLEISFDCGANGKLLTLKDNYIFIKLFTHKHLSNFFGKSEIKIYFPE